MFWKILQSEFSFKNALKKNARTSNDNHLEWTENILEFSNHIPLNRPKL